MSSLNSYRDSTSADYLNQVRKYVAENKVVNPDQNISINYIMTFDDSVNLSDTATVDANTQTFSDTINLSDTVTSTDLGRDFRCTNDAGGGLSGGTAIRVSFWVTS